MAQPRGQPWAPFVSLSSPGCVSFLTKSSQAMPALQRYSRLLFSGKESGGELGTSGDPRQPRAVWSSYSAVQMCGGGSGLREESLSSSWRGISLLNPQDNGLTQAVVFTLGSGDFWGHHVNCCESLVGGRLSLDRWSSCLFNVFCSSSGFSFSCLKKYFLFLSFLFWLHWVFAAACGPL